MTYKGHLGTNRHLDVNFALRPQELVYAPPCGIQHISGLSSRCHPRAPPCPKASGTESPAAVSPPSVLTGYSPVT